MGGSCKTAAAVAADVEELQWQLGYSDIDKIGEDEEDDLPWLYRHFEGNNTGAFRAGSGVTGTGAGFGD